MADAQTAIAQYLQPQAECAQLTRRHAMTRSETSVSGHTPGPWRVEPGDSVVYVRAIAGRKMVAMTNTKSYYERHDSRDLLNAHLIAAAPDMLLALKLAALAHPSSKHIGIIRAAIAKAAPPRQPDRQGET